MCSVSWGHSCSQLVAWRYLGSRGVQAQRINTPPCTGLCPVPHLPSLHPNEQLVQLGVHAHGGRGAWWALPLTRTRQPHRAAATTVLGYRAGVGVGRGTYSWCRPVLTSPRRPAPPAHPGERCGTQCLCGVPSDGTGGRIRVAEADVHGVGVWVPARKPHQHERPRAGSIHLPVRVGPSMGVPRSWCASRLSGRAESARAAPVRGVPVLLSAWRLPPRRRRARGIVPRRGAMSGAGSCSQPANNIGMRQAARCQQHSPAAPGVAVCDDWHTTVRPARGRRVAHTNARCAASCGV